MFALPHEIAEFVQRGVAAAVSCCNETLQPSMARVIGTRVTADGRLVTVLVLRSTSSALLRDAQTGKKIAAVFCLPENERALQIKGVVTAIEAPHSDDRQRILEHRIDFADQIEPKGYQREFSDYYHAGDSDDLVALSFIPDALFEQTPGPQAGRCVSAA